MNTKTSTWAKVFGWVQFGLQALGTLAQPGSIPHGWTGWLALVGSLATAIGVHQASSTDGSK